MHRGLVLIADGDPESSATMRALLEAKGHDVVGVPDGVAAIAELHGAEFDVAVLELDLTGRRAFDVIAAAHHLSPDTEVIVVARGAQLAAAVECIRLGIFDLLDKDTELGDETLSLAVARAIERRRLRATMTLFHASHEIFASQDAEQLPRTIVDIAARGMAADDVALALPGRDGVLRTLHTHSVNDAVRLAASEEVGDDLAAIVARLGTPVLLPEDAARVGKRVAKVHSSIVFPLLSGERRIGVLTISRVGDPRPYRRTDVERASIVASQVLLAVDNAALVRRTIEAERLATIGQLAAGVAHEINNPLTYILASGTDARDTIEELRKEAGAEGPEAVNARVAALLLVADELADVCDGGRRIADVARDLRTLARGHAPSREIVDLGDAIRSAARVAGPRVREGARLDLDLAEGTSIEGHAGRLTQVFVNLFVNAAQAGTGKSRLVTIVVRTYIEDERVIATVRDDGPGIAPEHLDLLFQPFFSTKTMANGTGLGLSLTQSIVAEHGGTINVASELGSGATFTLSFPRVPHTGKTPASDDDSGIFPREARFVFIDEDRRMLRSYERWFGRDHDVVTVDSGLDAVQLLTVRRQPCVIVCALGGTVLRGREVFAAVCRERPDLADHFLFVTEEAPGAEDLAFLASCGRPLLRKPFDVEALRRALAALTDAA